MGSISDPTVDDDGLGLTGPGAPARGFGSKATSEHPVKARLLERARQLQTETEPTGESSGQARRVTSEPGDWIAAHDARVKQELEAPAAPPQDEPAPSEELPPGMLHTPGAAKAIPFLDEEPESPPPAATAAPVTPSSEAPPVAPHNEFKAPSLPADFPGAPTATAQLTPPPAAVASELERIARRSTTTGPALKLSPNMTALLGGLLGLTVIGSLGVYLSKQDGTSSPLEEKPAAAAVAPVEEKPKEVEKPQRKKVEGPWRVEQDANKAGHRLITGKIGKQAFLRAIQDAGLPKSEAYRAYTALKGQLDLDHCKSSDTFMALVKGSEKTLVGFEYVISKEEVYQAKPNDEGHLEGSKLDLKVARNQIRRSFIHDGKSFEESARRAGFDPGIASIAETSLRGHSALSDFKAGDRFRIIAQEVTVLGDFSRYSGLEAMEILRPGEEPRRIYYYSHPLEGGHYDTNARAPYEGGWRKPIPDAPRTSPFNPKRMHPILKRVRPHNGTDFGCSTGTPIGATSPGTIVFRGPGGGYGNLIRIKHDGGYESGYAHLSRFEKGLNTGDRVERMQIIGYCGSTGRSTGPHLHFEMKKDGKFIDAESLNLDGLRVLPKDHRDEFAKVRAKYDPILDEIPLPEPLKLAPSPAAEEASEASPSADSEEAESEEESSDGAQAMDAEEASAAPSKSPAAAPAQPTPSGPSAPAQAVKPSAIFLSDAELLRMQSASDDGEVRE